MTIQFHPLADLFPLIEGTEFDELVASIKAHGLREPITLFEEMILDGRNRHRACERANVEPRFEQFTDGDPHEFVADKNIHRRHLNESQRSMIAAKMAALAYGTNQFVSKTKEGQICTSLPPTVRRAAEILNVSRSSVISARKILSEGTVDEIRAIEQGKAAVCTVADQIRKKIPAQKRILRSGKTSGHGQRSNAGIWGNLRTGLEAICSLPHPNEVVRIARGFEKRSGDLLTMRLPSSLNWLEEFSDAWSNRD